MGVDITFLGQSGFLLSDGTTTVAIDPWLSGNPVATTTADDINCDVICVTHGHEDHFTDVPAIAKRTGATVYAPYEICEYLGEQGIQAVEPMNPGGYSATPFGWVAFVPAVHSSSFKGRYMGAACGVVIHLGGTTLYHCGDTALFGDMKMIAERHNPHIAMIPIGDRFTMGPKHGAVAAELMRVPIAIPMHYGTFPLLAPDASHFKPQGVDVRVIAPGDTWRYDGG